MCDGSITTMVSEQSRIRYCWILYCTNLFQFSWVFSYHSQPNFEWELNETFLFTANNQSNERLSATESISNAIASSSSSTRNLTGNILNSINQPNFRNAPKIPTDDFDGVSDQQRAGADSNIDDDDLASVHLMLEPHLRPPPPDPKSDVSKQIFDEHKQLAKEYLKVGSAIKHINFWPIFTHRIHLSYIQIHTEIAYVTKHRDEILSKMDPEKRQERLELCNKLMEKVWTLKYFQLGTSIQCLFLVRFVGGIIEISSKSQTTIGTDSNELKTTTGIDAGI